jgi:hypothetical protein
MAELKHRRVPLSISPRAASSRSIHSIAHLFLGSAAASEEVAQILADPGNRTIGDLTSPATLVIAVGGRRGGGRNADLPSAGASVSVTRTANGA